MTRGRWLATPTERRTSVVSVGSKVRALNFLSREPRVRRRRDTCSEKSRGFRTLFLGLYRTRVHRLEGPRAPGVGPLPLPSPQSALDTGTPSPLADAGGPGTPALPDPLLSPDPNRTGVARGSPRFKRESHETSSTGPLTPSGTPPNSLPGAGPYPLPQRRGDHTRTGLVLQEDQSSSPRPLRALSLLNPPRVDPGRASSAHPLPSGERRPNL